MSDLEATQAAIARIGTRFDSEVVIETRALYRPLVEAASWASRHAVSDIAYGDAERQRLDVYPADTPHSPVILFVHGGGFIGGDKANDPPFYGNVGRYFADRGFCTVAMNYRLAPDHAFPAGAEDVARAIGWIAAHIGDHGGDPNRLHLLGQSAGASHVATYMFDPAIVRGAPAGVRAAALMSGFYLAQSPLAPGPAQYFGSDETLWHARSPATHVSAHPPLLVSVAEFDPAPIAEQSLMFAQALTRHDGRTPQLSWFEGENHISTLHGLGLGTDLVGRRLCEFFASA